MKRVPIAGPSIDARDIAAVTDAVTNAWYENANMYHERLESSFRAHTGMQYAMALPSCTSGIHLSLWALGVGPGDEVIVPELTWIATAAPIEYLGAHVVFADVDRATWCLDPGSLERVITARTKAVIPVDLYGGIPDMDRIRAIAARHGVFVLEDAAEAAGATLHARPAGGLGDAAVFSFHGSKTLTAGEGGMLVMNDGALFDRAQRLRDHGRVPGGRTFWNTEVGQKYKMSSMQAALAWSQLLRLPELVAQKRQAFEWYRQRLAHRSDVTLNEAGAGVLSTYWMVTAIVDPASGWDKETLGAALAAEGIDTRPIFYPLSAMPAFEAHPATSAARSENVVAYAVGPYGINLPSSLRLTEEDVERVCSALCRLLDEGCR